MRKHNSAKWSSFVKAALLACSGVLVTATAPAVAQKSSGAGPAALDSGQRAHIRSEVDGTLRRTRGVNASTVRVRVTPAGVVILDGRVCSLADRQAAILLAKLDIFPEEVALRKQVGERYSEMISSKWPDITVPYIAEGNTSVYAQYTIQVNDREATIDRMSRSGIPYAVHYPVPLNEQPALRTDRFDLAVSSRLARRVVSLPMHPYLTNVEMGAVVASLG